MEQSRQQMEKWQKLLTRLYHPRLWRWIAILFLVVILFLLPDLFRI